MDRILPPTELGSVNLVEDEVPDPLDPEPSVEVSPLRVQQEVTTVVVEFVACLQKQVNPDYG